jgi:hypothetical protein
LLGTIAQNRIFSWIREGKVLKLGEGWEYLDHDDSNYDGRSIHMRSAIRRTQSKRFTGTGSRSKNYNVNHLDNNNEMSPASSIESSSDS